MTDERAKNGKGDVVVKFSPDGRVLLTLGKPGMPGDGPDMFHAPSDVAVAANGDIFVADGHGGNTNGRIVKFSKDGKFIKAWGKPGKAQGEFDSRTGSRSIPRADLRRRSRQQPHPDLRSGRKLRRRVEAVRPAERGLHRPQRRDVRGRPQSDQTRNPGFTRGVRIGSVKDGKVTAFIPQPSAELGTGEGVAADEQGNVFQGYNSKRTVRRFVKN